MVSTGWCGANLCTIVGFGTDHISSSFPTPRCLAESSSLPFPWLHTRCPAYPELSSGLSCTRFGTLSSSLKSVALLTSSLLLCLPGERSVLVPSARLRPSVSVMLSTYLGSASHPKNGQPFMVCPYRTLRFNRMVSYKPPSSPPNTPQAFTINDLASSFRKPLQITLIRSYHEVVAVVEQSDVLAGVRTSTD